MEKDKKKLSRKNFLSWGAGITSLLVLPSFFRSKKKKQGEKVKMLTQDGRLVEIAIENIPAKKGKIKSADIHTWINKKPSSL
jgi:hypothetical protein